MVESRPPVCAYEKLAAKGVDSRIGCYQYKLFIHQPFGAQSGPVWRRMHYGGGDAASGDAINQILRYVNMNP